MLIKLHSRFVLVEVVSSASNSSTSLLAVYFYSSRSVPCVAARDCVYERSCELMAPFRKQTASVVLSTAVSFNSSFVEVDQRSAQHRCELNGSFMR